MIDRIADQLNEIINKEKRKAIQEHGKEWKEKYEWLVREIQDTKENAEELRDDMKKNSLTVNEIEAEGFLRCAIQLCGIVENIENSFK